MARVAQARKICQLPLCRRFQPVEMASTAEIQLTVDEYETLRLMDLEGFTQSPIPTMRPATSRRS